MLDHLGVEAHLSAVGRYVLCGAGDFATALVQGLEATASSSAALAARARASRMGVAGYGGGVSARELRAVNEVAARETSVFGDPLAQRFELTPGHPRDPHAVFSEHSHTMVDFVHGTYRLEWPNSLLLPELAIGKLADAQRSILRVRHARLALQEAHDRVHEAGHVDVSSLGHRGGGERGRAGRALALRRLRRLSLLAAEFGHFMNAIESHVGGAVHVVRAPHPAELEATPGRRAEASLASVRDAQDVHTVHDSPALTQLEGVSSVCPVGPRLLAFGGMTGRIALLDALSDDLAPIAELKPATLARLWNVVSLANTRGGAQAIRINYETGVLEGASDPRKDGCALGY